MSVKVWSFRIGLGASMVMLLLGLAASNPAGALPSPQAPVAWDDPAVRAKIHPALLKQLVLGQSGQAPVVVEMKSPAELDEVGRPAQERVAARAALVESLVSTAQASQKGVRAFLAAQELAGEASQVQSLWAVNAVGVHASPRTIEQLAARPDVALIREDRWRQWLDTFDSRPAQLGISFPLSDLHSLTSMSEWGVQKIRADHVWAALGITGTGVVVANLDTGVDWLHPALAANYRGCVKGLCQHASSWYDATDGGALYPVDGNGHGTHTMGTLTGQGGIGVAPGARWIAVRALDSQGYGYDTWIHAGFQWLLAPGGDAARAPDLVSNSWGSLSSGDTTFRNDLRVLRAAGILPVFSAGNHGSGAGTVSSPGSLPEAFAVGATDDTDMVAYFSARGPSPWGEVKPQVVAPGVRVRSAWPGGGYQVLDGTSMAAPHVAGVAALMLSANPSLTITATAHVLTTTAVPLTTTVPNNASGWGRVDAYQAVQAVANIGVLSGTVRHAVTLAPLANAQVTASGAHTMTAQTDANGHYALGLSPGVYRVTVNAFGYVPGSPVNVVITGGTTATRNFNLAPLPAGLVRGLVRDAVTGLPLTATVAVMGTPLTQTARGVLSVTLPVGTYTLRALQVGYRVVTATVTVTAGQTVTQDLDMFPGPNVLVVDSGAWYSDSQVDYFQAALDELSYAYATWTIRDPSSDVPRGNDLLPYDVVIWSSPQDSPGYLGANLAMTTFLTLSHHLLVSGQNVAYWDGGGSFTTFASYLSQYLKTLYVADDSGARVLRGTPGDIMSGLVITIAGPGGADNATAPDEIAVSDSRYASEILAYQGDGSGGHKVGLCLPYRGVVLPFGLEAINNSLARQQVMRRVMDYFASPRQTAGLELHSAGGPLIARPGDTVTHTLVLRNVSQVVTDTIRLTAQAGVWPRGGMPLTATLRSCDSLTVAVTVTVPAGVGWNAWDRVTLEARSSLSPSVAVTAVLTTKTPAPVLLVDDHRWYDKLQVYRDALGQSGMAYDIWQVNPQGWSEVPSASRLSWYPVVVWFTGYNWFDPVKPAGVANLEAYLGGGGRLFLSSAFYIYYFEHDSLTRQMGVMTYTDDLTTTIAYGSANSPIGSHLGALTLQDPYPQSGFFTLSGAVAPERSAVTAMRGSADRALAIHRVQGSSRTVFMGMPFEALTGLDAQRVMGRIVGWLGWLGDSTVQASRATAWPGQRVGYTLTLRHTGPTPIHATLTATLPLSVTLAPASLSPGARVDPAGRVVTWTGTLAPGAAIAASYSVTLDVRLSSGKPLTTTVVFYDDTHSLPFDQSVVTRVGSPDLSCVYTAPASARSGAVVTHTLLVTNSGLAAAPDARITWLLPWRTQPITATQSGSGSITIAGDTIYWRGPLEVGAPIMLNYQANAPRVPVPQSQLGEALLWDGAGGAWERSVWTDVIPYRFYLPIVFRQ